MQTLYIYSLHVHQEESVGIGSVLKLFPCKTYECTQATHREPAHRNNCHIFLTKQEISKIFKFLFPKLPSPYGNQTFSQETLTFGTQSLPLHEKELHSQLLPTKL